MSRRRRRQAPLSTADTLFQSLILLLVLPAPFISAGLLGGARIWVAFPLMTLTFSGGALWFFAQFFGDKSKQRPILPGLGLMALWLGFAAVHAWKISVIPGASVNELLQVFAYVVTYYVLATLPLVRRGWKVLLGSYLILISLVVWYGLLQYAHEMTTVWIWPRPEQYGNRVSSTFICPNHFAHFAVMGALFGLTAAFTPRLKPVLRLIGGYTFLVCLPGIFLSLSRSGLIGLVVGLGLLSLFVAARTSFKRMCLVGLGGGVLLSGLLLALYSLYEPFQKRIEEALQGDVRLQIWPDTLELIKSALWLGYGGGSYEYVIGVFRNSFSRPELYIRYAHNEYLHALAEYGLVGLGIVLALLTVVVVRTAKGIRQGDREQVKLLRLGWLAILAATAAHSLFDFNMHMFANMMALVLFGAILVPAAGEQRAPGSDGQVFFKGTMLASALSCLLAAILCFCVVQSQRYFFSSYAKDTLLNPALRESRLLRAAEWNPLDPEPARLLGHFYKTRFILNRNAEQKAQFGEKSMDWYGRAIQANARDTESLYGKSWVLYHSGEIEPALELMREVVAKEPFSAFYFMQQGVMLRKAGDLSAAKAAYEKAAKLAPQHKGIRESLQELKKVQP